MHAALLRGAKVGPCARRQRAGPVAIRVAVVACATWRIAMLALLTGLGGCATLSSVMPSVQVTTPKSRALLLDKVPFHPQTEYQCGPAALAGVLNASGVAITPQVLAPQVYLPDRRGSLQVELAAATRRAGRIPYPVERTPEALTAELAAGRPVLVLQNLLVRTVPRWHYAVLVGADPDRNRFILNSGTERASPVRASTFVRTWDWAGRWGIVALRPGELPARVEPAEYLTATADFEAVAGAAAARPAWRAALKRWPQEPRVHLALGNQAHAAGDLRAAVRHYRAGLARAPADPVLGNNLASVLGELGCPVQARIALDTAETGLPPGSRWSEQLARTRTEIDAIPGGRGAACERSR